MRKYSSSRSNINSHDDGEEGYSKMRMVAISVLTVLTGTFLFIAFSSKSSSDSSIKQHLVGSQSSFQSKSLITEQAKTTDSIKPNFVFILADDLGWNSIGYEDYDLTFASPFITSLAKKGVIMSNYYGQEICTPSRASLLTGRYPLSIGMQYGNVLENGPWGMSLGETTIAEALRDHGQYTNYALGKWHLGHYTPEHLPTSRGFHNYLGYVSGKNFYWSKNSPDYEDVTDFMYADTECYNVYNGSDRADYSTFVYRDKAVKTIQEHDYKKGPMFLYFASQAVHDPFADCTAYSRYDGGIPSTADYMDGEMYKKIKNSVVGEKRQQYAMSLVLLDNAVSDIYNALEAAQQLNNTYIIFASDNGACLYGGGKNAPLRGSKGTLFEGGTKVDAFIYSPLLPSEVAGTVYSGLMHVSDWFPTMLDLANIDSFVPKPGYAFDGVSQATPMLTNTVSANKRSNMVYNMYTNIQYNDYKYWNIQTNSSVGVRDERYKLLHTFTGNGYDDWFDYTTTLSDDFNLDQRPCSQMNSGNAFEHMLFDLKKDPFETTNLYYNENYASIKSELEALVTTYSNQAHAVDYGALRSPEAYWFWTQHSGFMQPWKKLDNTGNTLRKCDKKGALYAPDNL